MSDIVIRNIEMPKDKQYSLTIFPNGRVIQHWEGVVFGETKAIKLPPHGRLIDADALIKKNKESKGKLEAFKGDAKLTEVGYKSVIWEIQDLENAPTILEASKED